MKKVQSKIINRISLLAVFLMTIIVSTNAQSQNGNKENANMKINKTEQQLIDLSKQKWQWMSERKVDLLDALLDDKAVFVHMGATMSKKQELDVIKGGMIQYKKADIHEVSVNIIGSTAILLNRITLLAIVGGNEVTNPFVVTEVYVKQKGAWKLGSLSFTRLLTQ